MDMPFVRLQSFLANTNCIAAETYARWRVKKGNIAAVLKVDLLGAMKQFYDEVVDFCKSQHDKVPLDPLERWINFAAVAAPSVSNNSRGKAKQEEQLLPTVIQYDPVTGQPVNSQIERVDGRKQIASIEVVPWAAWFAPQAAMALGDDLAHQGVVTMVFRAHHISGRETNQCVQICLDAETGKRWVRAQKAMELEQLYVFPGAPRREGS